MVEECEHGDNKPFESLNNLGDEFNCQKFCGSYDNPDFHKCTFFIFNRLDNFCDLYDYDVKDYMKTCLKKGMTLTPAFDLCLDFDQPCAVSTFLLTYTVQCLEVPGWRYL